MVQWLGLCAFTPKGLGSIPGQGTKILQAAQCGQNKKKRKRQMKDLNFFLPQCNFSCLLTKIQEKVYCFVYHHFGLDF